MLQLLVVNGLEQLHACRLSQVTEVHSDLRYAWLVATLGGLPLGEALEALVPDPATVNSPLPYDVRAGHQRPRTRDDPDTYYLQDASASFAFDAYAARLFGAFGPYQLDHVDRGLLRLRGALSAGQSLLRGEVRSGEVDISRCLITRDKRGMIHEQNLEVTPGDVSTLARAVFQLAVVNFRLAKIVPGGA